MIYLWVFGNAICATLGNSFYPLVYLFLGICASIMHLIFSGAPAIGASGAINGIVGMAFVLFPTNKLHCAYVLPFIGLVKFGKFTVKSYWMIGVWFLLDIVGILVGGGHVAYWAHVGGFVGGMALAFSITALKWAETTDPTLIDVVTGRTKDLEHERREDLQTRVIEMKAQALLSPGRTVLPREPAAGSADEVHGLWSGEGRAAPPVPRMDTAPAKKPAPPRLSREEPAPLSSVPATLRLRLLRVVHAAGQWTCYFANDGDGVSDLRVDPDDALTVEIHPQASIKSKEPCWMKMHWTGTPPAGAVPLTISYDNRAGGRSSQRIVVPLTSGA
jgi:hypothetical protein